MSGLVQINLQSGAASGDAACAGGVGAGVEYSQQSGQSIGLVPAAQACAPAAASCAGAGIGIVMQAPPGLPGPVGPVGPSDLTGGAGIRIVGTEIRLSIGTLPAES